LNPKISSKMKCSWPLPPAEFDLPEGEVHLWSARLDLPEGLLQKCAGVLWEDEVQRAQRFRMGSLRNHYIAGRGMLRLLLTHYLPAEPASFPLIYQAHGKPELGLSWKTSGLEFNVSHSHGLAIYAFTRGRPIGVDVESIRPMPNAAALMERFFSAEEVHQWQQMPAPRQLRAFFQGWTRKEAWLKAVGSGLSFPLDEFCVTLDGPARVLSIHGNRDEAAQWWLESHEPCDGYVAAVAMQGHAAAVKSWRFGEFS
jgi:4'-phosphopantetheinyl transferase